MLSGWSKGRLSSTQWVQWMWGHAMEQGWGQGLLFVLVQMTGDVMVRWSAYLKETDWGPPKGVVLEATSTVRSS